MAGFFIDRPIFAVVIALFICLGGVLALPFLPIAQYPIIAPPSISVSTSYPGASPENLYTSVTRLIEEELNGANGIIRIDQRFAGAGRDHRQLRSRHRSEHGIGRSRESD